MTAAPAPDPRRRLAPVSPSALYGAVAAGTLAITALVLSGESFLAVAAILALPLGLAMIRWPESTILIVVFCLYTNAAVVAVKFHGLPFAAAAGFPLILFVPIARAVLVRGEKIVITPTLFWLFGFAVVQIAGGLFSVKPELAIDAVMETVTEGMLLYFLVTNAVRTPRDFRQVVWTLLLAGAVMGALVFHQQLTGSFDSNYQGFAQVSNAAFETGEESAVGDVMQLRLEGPVGEQNRFAQIMAMLFPLALYQYWAARSRRARGLAVIAFVLICFGFSLAFSRGAAVGLGITLVVMLLMGEVRLRSLGLVFVAVLAIGVAIPQYAARLGSLVDVARLAAGLEEGGIRNADGATRNRVTEMAAAVLVFLDHPILGVGPGMYEENYQHYAELAGGKVKSHARESHSLYLGLAAENGLLGLFAFSWILALTLRDLRVARRALARGHPDLALLTTGLSLALVVYLATGLFLHLGYARYLWIMVAVAGVAHRLARTLPPAPAPARPAAAR